MGRMIRRIGFALLAVCFVAGGWGLLYWRATKTEISHVGRDQVVRLHVLANSDRPEDQALKLKVRDAVLDYLGPKLASAGDADQVRRILRDNRAGVLTVARRALDENGGAYSVDMQVGTFDFPIKRYGSLVLPAGKYEALRILIGAAQGANWWCVLFPPLCFIDATNAMAAAPPPADGAAPPPVQLKSKLWEWLEGR